MRICSFAALAFVFLSTGCATVKEHRELTQLQNRPLTASVRSTLFHLSKKGDLPNVFGRANIYGGKVDKGYAEVKLRAIHDEGVVELLVYDVTRESAETTMDRYKPFNRGLVNVSQTQAVNMGAADTNAIPVTLDTKSDKQYVVSGIRVRFLQVKPSSVVYTLTDLESKR
jgi:hypothetical protein